MCATSASYVVPEDIFQICKVTKASTVDLFCLWAKPSNYNLSIKDISSISKYKRLVPRATYVVAENNQKDCELINYVISVGQTIKLL